MLPFFMVQQDRSPLALVVALDLFDAQDAGWCAPGFWLAHTRPVTATSA
jgi:hypothetical protein